jgi:MFS family permease
MANIALPTVARDFDTSFGSARWIVLSYLLASTLFSFVVGELADRHGQRRALLMGIGLFALGTLVCGIAGSFWILIVARAVQGVGAAALIALPMSVVSAIVPKERLGRVIGLLASMSAVGTASGPSIGGLVLATFGWRALFFVMASLAFVSFLLVAGIVPTDVAPTSKSRDGSGLLAALKFILLEPSVRSPLIYNMVVSAVLMATLITGPFYLTHALRLAPGRMGVIMSAGPIASILFGFTSGYLVDRCGTGSAMKFGFVQLVVGAVSFVIASSQFGEIGFALSAVLLSLGYQLFLSANSTRLMKSVPKNRQGLSSGSLGLSRNLGLILGTYVMGGIFDFFAQNSGAAVAPPDRVEHGLQVTFIFGAIMILLSLGSYMAAEKRRKPVRSSC